MLKNLLSRLFAAAPASTEAVAASVEYKGYKIQPQPLRDGELWRVAGSITRDSDGQAQVYRLIRADTMPDHEQAVATTISKARLVIDQQGERMFDQAAAGNNAG